MPEYIQKCFFQHNLSVFKKMLVENTWPKFNTEQHLERIDQVIEHCTERGKRIYSPGAGGFNVLNHDDFVMRNMLFQKCNDKITDVQFVRETYSFFFWILIFVLFFCSWTFN